MLSPVSKPAPDGENTSVAGSRSTNGKSAGLSGIAVVTRICWRSGWIGSVSPAIVPICAAHGPAALTTVPVLIVPSLVFDGLNRAVRYLNTYHADARDGLHAEQFRRRDVAIDYAGRIG